MLHIVGSYFLPLGLVSHRSQQEKHNVPGGGMTAKKTMKVGFYITMASILAILLLIVLSILYADSLNPMDFFYTGKKNFIISGSPVNVVVNSSVYREFSSQPNHDASLSVSGRSVVMPKTEDRFMITYGNGTTVCATGIHKIVSSPDAFFMVRTGQAHEKNDYSLYVYLGSNNSSAWMHEGTDIYSFTFWGSPGSRNYYNTSVSSQYTRLTNQLSVTRGSVYTDKGQAIGPGGKIIFNGTIDVPECNEMMAKMDATTIGIMPGTSVSLYNCPGRLLISKKDFKTSSADIITIKSINDPGHPINIFLYDGVFTIGDRASSINFRYNELLRQPVKLFFNDGYINFFLSFLAGMLTLTAKRLVGSLRLK